MVRLGEYISDMNIINHTHVRWGLGSLRSDSAKLKIVTMEIQCFAPWCASVSSTCFAALRSLLHERLPAKCERMAAKDD